MARSVRSQAIKDVAAAAARLSILHTRMWCVPAKTEANPTMQAISANSKNMGVIELPAHMTTKPTQYSFSIPKALDTTPGMKSNSRLIFPVTELSWGTDSHELVHTID
jgi:hypothetical protein